VRVRGQLIADVKFAGRFARDLEKGGHFTVARCELSPGEWEITSMDRKGKVLFFKTIAVEQKECRSGCRAVPENLTLAEAANTLKLRLGGVAAVLETRLHQAQSEPTPPIDFLSCLVADELHRRGDRLLERRKKPAAFRSAGPEA
jgi:hypothetical protein